MVYTICIVDIDSESYSHITFYFLNPIKVFRNNFPSEMKYIKIW